MRFDKLKRLGHILIQAIWQLTKVDKNYGKC